MFRVSAKYLISAAEASNFLSVTAPKALATDNASARQKLIPTMIEIFNDHPTNASVVSQTAQLMTQIDQEASDSFAIAQHSECLRVLVSDVMKKNIHNVEIKEHCCRAIANVCLLPNDTFDILNHGGGANTAETTSTSSLDGTAQPSSAPKAFADVAVELGAIETVIGTMSHVSRLSEKGRCWAATALQNLLMFATTPQATLRAGKAGAEEVLSTFLIEMCHDASAMMSDFQNEVRRAGGNTETERVRELAVTLLRLLIAMDAASVSLARMMNAPAEENANNIDTRAQTASANVIDAALRTMITTLGIATILTKAQTNDLKSVSFSNPEFAELRDEIALPVLHKGWEVVKAISAHKKNLPVIFNAIAEVNSDFEGMFSRNEPWLRAASAPAPSNDSSVTNAASASSNPTGHQQTVNHILEVIVNHAMLRIAPLVSLSAPNQATPSENNNNDNNNVPRLAFDAALSAITDLIAPRSDITAEESSSTTDATSSTSHHNNRHGEEGTNDIPVAEVVNDSESVGYGNESGGVSRSVPTENAATAIGCIANGVAANTAVTAIPKQWRALIEMVEAEGNSSSPAAANKRRKAALSSSSSSKGKNVTMTEEIDSDEKNVLQRQYDTARDACGFFGLLSNLADAGDTVASGPNAVAIAAGVLEDYLSRAQKASFRLAQNTTLNASSSVQNAKIPPAQILLENLQTQHNEVVAIQRLLIPVVGKAFTLVWNAVGTPQGADAVRTLEVAQCVQSINKTTSLLVQTLQSRLNELLAQQVEAFEKDSSSSASGSAPPPATPSAIIDGLQELERVGLQLYQKLDAIVVNPVYAQNKHTKKE